jgi:hypothetical protein
MLRNLGSIAFAASVLFTPHGNSCTALAQTVNAPAKYTFNTTTPPLLKDFHGQILDFSDSMLSQTVGTATWTQVDRPYAGLKGPFGVLLDPGWIVNASTFILVRTRHWARIGTLRTIGADKLQDTYTVVRGYSKTDSTTFTQSLEGSASLDVFSVLKADVKTALNMTVGDSETWKVEETRAEQKNYDCPCTIQDWYLYDTLTLNKTTSYSGHCCATTNQQITSVVQAVANDYEDVDKPVAGQKPGEAPFQLDDIFRGQITKTINPRGLSVQ